jgi:hypothetical protein
VTVPPLPVRRVLLTPIIPAVLVLLILTFPLFVPGAFVTRYLPGRLRVLSLSWLLFTWLFRETWSVLLLFFLWVASGFGYWMHTDFFQDQHTRLAGWYLWGIVGVCQRSLGLRIVVEESPGALVVEPRIPSRQMLVCSRHAGAGDSFLLMHMLINTFGRTPAIVLKDTLQWLPSLDILLNRLDAAFISPNPPPGAGVIDQIGRLAAGLHDDGALVIFPEGGNFTARRRTRALEKLASDESLRPFLARAQELTTVLPPRPGGLLAALEHAPEADVVVVAHAGLEGYSTVPDILSSLPMEHSVRMAWWHVPREEIPEDRGERTDWLYEWWERIDTWVEDHREPGMPNPDARDAEVPTPEGESSGPRASSQP